MDNTLRDPLSVKVGQIVEEDEVLEGNGALGSDRHGGGFAVNGVAMAGCQDIRDLYDAEQPTHYTCHI